ncbi:MAG: aminoglycoside phosphotransferase family protein [Pseudomonadota bacterium]
MERLQIDESLVRSLLAQCPELSGESIQLVGHGWDNVIVRVGSTLALRLPYHPTADELILKEQQWIPVLAPHLPLAVPLPVHCGKPQGSYPYHWTLQRWLPGVTANVSVPAADQAGVLVHFLQALHRQPLPSHPPRNRLRDCRLAGKDPAVQSRLVTLRESGVSVSPAIEAIWRRGLATAIDVPRSLIMGDLHSQNVLVRDSKLAAVIDWGDLCVGDPATDLASIWCLLPTPASRQVALTEYAATESTIARAMAWAAFFGLVFVHRGLAGSAASKVIGHTILRRLREDDPSTS